MSPTAAWAAAPHHRAATHPLGGRAREMQCIHAVVAIIVLEASALLEPCWQDNGSDTRRELFDIGSPNPKPQHAYEA